MRLASHVCALAATVLALLAGAWLTVSPWVLGVPQPAAGWGAQTLTDFWTGLGVTLAAGITLALYGGSLAAAVRRAGVVAAPSPRSLGSAARPDRGAGSSPASGQASGDGAGARNELAALTGAGAAPAAGTAPPAPHPGAVDLDDVLVPLAAALLSDLVQRRAGAVAPPGGGTAGREGGGPT